MEQNDLSIQYPVIVRDIRSKKGAPNKKYVIDGSIYDSSLNYREFANFDEYEYSKLSIGFHFTLVLLNLNSLYFVKYKCVLLDDENKIVVAQLMEDRGTFVRPDSFYYEEMYSCLINRHRLEMIDDLIKEI